MAGWTGLWWPNAQIHQLLSSRFHRLLLSSRQNFCQEVLGGVLNVPLAEACTQELTGSNGECRGMKKIPGTFQQIAPSIIRVISARPPLGILLCC